MRIVHVLGEDYYIDPYDPNSIVEHRIGSRNVQDMELILMGGLIQK